MRGELEGPSNLLLAVLLMLLQVVSYLVLSFPVWVEVRKVSSLTSCWTTRASAESHPTDLTQTSARTPTAWPAVYDLDSMSGRRA